VSDSTRARIVAAATQLIAQRGFEGTSLSAVADAVGLRKQSLLHHFKTKDDLRQGVLESLLSHWNDTMPRVLAAAANVQGRLSDLLTVVFDFYAEDPDRARVLLRELMERPEEMRAMIAQHNAIWIEVVCDVLRQGQESGVIREDLDPEAFVIQTFCSITAGVACDRALNVVFELPTKPAKRTTKRKKPAPSPPIAARYVEEVLTASAVRLFVPREE